MNKKQKTALRLSIKHWKNMRDNYNCGEEPTARDCPCCQLFRQENGDDCQGCPIFEYTKEPLCLFTPYGNAVDAWPAGAEIEPENYINAWKLAAQVEIDFLKEVLKKGLKSNLSSKVE